MYVRPTASHASTARMPGDRLFPSHELDKNNFQQAAALSELFLGTMAWNPHHGLSPG